MLTSVPLPAARPTRVQAIDIVRSLVMVVMALDHVRDFWCYTPFQPDDLTQTTPPTFLYPLDHSFLCPYVRFSLGREHLADPAATS